MTESFKPSTRPHLVWCLRLALGVALLLAAPRASADPGDIGSLFLVDDNDPVKSIPTEEERNAHPLEFGYYLQDLIAHAEAALHHDDWSHAATFYEALARIVPDRALVFSRLCMVYGKLGQFDIAAANCSRAIQLPGAVVNDHLQFIRYTLLKKNFTPADTTRIDASLAHLRAHVPTLAPPAPSQTPTSAAAVAPSAVPTSSAARAELAKQLLRRAVDGTALAVLPPPDASKGNLPVEVEVLACRLAVRIKDSKRLAECTAALKQYHADERLIISFDWSQALIDGDRARASAILDHAKTLHISEATLGVMVDEQDRHFKTAGVLGLFKRLGAPAVAALVAFLVATLGGIWWALWGSKRRKIASAGPS
jgi:hypothetical protein